jgi:RND family efflux transporter MFP subunit
MADEDLSRLKIEKPRIGARPARRRKPFYWAAALVVAAALLFLVARGAALFAPTAETTSVSMMYPSQTFTLLTASGYVVAQRKAAVASKVTGRLISISVEEGNEVRKGQVIARLENNDVEAALKEARANVNVARFNLEQSDAELRDATLDYNRKKQLVGRGYVAQSDFDAAEARHQKAMAAVAAAKAAVKAAEAALRSAEVALDYTYIRAPFDAVVLTKDADVGDIVTPIGAAADAKAAVVTIADMTSLQVEADVSESNIGKVTAGQPCEIQLDALPGLRFRGAVHMVVPTADRSKATVLVKVRFEDKDPRILPEMSAKVYFLSRPVGPEEQKPRRVVRPSAVVQRGGGKVVFAVKGDRVAQVPIETGARLGDMLEVLGGVEAGTRVVADPPAKLADGDRIKLAEK